MSGQKLTYIRYKTKTIISLFIQRLVVLQMYIDIQVIDINKENIFHCHSNAKTVSMKCYSRVGRTFNSSSIQQK